MISIICSNYNSDRWIANYCNYINSQHLHTFELVFVDANSSDNSLQYVRDFSFREGIEVTIISLQDRVAIYEAWNIGIKAAKYDYVMNFNTDDKLFRSSLLVLSSYLPLYPHVDVFYSNCFVSDDAAHSNLINFHNWMDANNITNLIEGCCVGPFPLLKKQTVIDAGMFNSAYWISGDYEMWCRMKSKGSVFLKIEEPMGVYYHNPEGVSTRPDLDRHMEHLRQDNLIRDTYR